MVREVRRRLARKREEWVGDIRGLEAENGELKSILDGMIKLVREEKNIKY